MDDRDYSDDENYLDYEYPFRRAYQAPFCGACGVMVSDEEELAHFGEEIKDHGEYVTPSRNPIFWTCVYRLSTLNSAFYVTETCRLNSDR